MAVTATSKHKKSVRAVARLQVNDVESVVRRSGVLAARVWRFSSEAARSNKVHLASGELRIAPYDDELVQRAKDELTNLMSYSYLKRTRLSKRRRSVSKEATTDLRLDLLQDVRRIADLFDVNLGNVQRNFEPLASDEINRSAAQIREVMNRALAEATKSNLPTQAATDYVLDELREFGVQPRSNQYVETLVRTHAGIAYGAAAKQSFAGDVDLWGWEYVTVGDDRVREEHALLDGVMRKKDDPFWETFWPPNGYNCRCQAVAIYDEDARQTPVPAGAEPDEGFDEDWAELVE